MSGTSADGVDAALVEVETLANRPERPVSFELVDHLTLPYGDAVRAEILAVQEDGDHAVERLTRLHFVLGHLFADAVERLCTDSGNEISSLDLIASHGQTVCHFPHLPAATDADGATLPGSEAWGARDADGTWVSPATLQIGEPAVIAERTGVAVMSNFRSRDVAAGGTGAPLVPRVDHLLFGGNGERDRIALNVGGIANLTWLRAGAPLEETLAFDTGPGNMVIDGLVSRITDGRRHLDEGGALARRGTVDEGLLAEFLEHPFLAQAPPKAAGRDTFGRAFTDRFLAAARERKLGDAALLATATALTAESVYRACRDHLPAIPGEVIVSGGGAHNVALLEQLAARFGSSTVTPSDYYGVDVDAKEAVAFALLAHLSLEGQAGNIPRVTGARRPVVLGDLTPGGGV